MPEPRVLTDAELDASVVQGDARDLLTTARHHRARAEKAEQAARRMARLLMDQERRGPFDYDNVPGGLVPRRPEMEVVFTTLGLPCPCPRDRWNKEVALREPEKGEG